MNDYGIVLKRNDNDYVINVDVNAYNSGYNVVPKSVDPYNAYNIDDVKAYCEQNPDKVITQHPLESYMQQLQELNEQQAQLDSVNAQLFDRMVQKVFNPDTQTMDEYIPTNEELLAQKAQLEASIASIKESLSTMMNNG